MATDSTKVRVAVSGAITKFALGATLPTTTAGALTGGTELGFVSDDGVEIELPDAGDSTPIKSWQGATTVRVIRTPSEDLPTWKFTLLETKKETVETYFGVTITTQSSTEGSFVWANAARPYNGYVIDVVDGAELIRDCVPRGIVTDVGSITYSNGDPIGYEVTISGEFDSTMGGMFRHIATALKTP